MGDFNFNWEDKSARKHLKQISDNFPISPTRISHNTGTQQTNQKESHNPLTWSQSKRFCVSTAKEQESKIPNKEQDRFKNTINRFNWSNLLAGKELHEGSTVLSNKLQYFIKEFTQKCRNRNSKNSLLWINVEISKVMKERDLAKKRKKRQINQNYVMINTILQCWGTK